MAESVEQLDPTEGLTVESIKKKAVRGAAILTGRNIFIQGVSFISVALLTVFLEPKDYGIFFLVSAFVNFLAYFGDIGFAASLIQKKENLEDLELKTIFITQQGLVLTILLIVFVATPILQNLYDLDQAAIYLLWAMGFSLLLSSLKTIPTVLMERSLEFNKWVIPQIIETITFNTVAVFLAWKGFGVTSFTMAILVRSILGLLVTYLIQPWFPSLAFSYKALKSLLRFGIPYQANTLLAMVKDDGMILFLGFLLGTTNVGLLGWAQKWAYAPLRFFMDQVIKVTFPAFSRLQDKKEELSGAVSKSIFFVCLLVFPSLVILVLMAPTLVEIIPKYNKWSLALFPLTILCITSALAAITTPLTNTLNAIGKISVTFRLMIMWTVLTWIFVPILTVMFGLNGAAFAFTLVGLSSIVALKIVTKYVSVDYLQSVGKPLLASMVLGLVLLVVRNLLPISFIQILVMGLVGLFVYLLIIFIIAPEIFNMTKGLLRK